MTINHMDGLIAIVGGTIIFLGSVYVIIALNVGWRFGYWLWGACLGGLMLFLSLFWVLTGLGPRGEEPLWVPIAASQDAIGQVEYEDATLSSPGNYPAGDWEDPDEGDPLAAEDDAFESAMSACFAFDEERVEQAREQIQDLRSPERTFLELRIGKADRVETETDVCEQVHSLIPDPEAGEVPSVEGEPAAFVNDIIDLRYTEEAGLLLGQAIIQPNTYDLRLTGDEEGLTPQAVGEPFRVVAYKDPGSLRAPAVLYLVLSLLWFGFHMWGLNRAEKQKLSPVAE